MLSKCTVFWGGYGRHHKLHFTYAEHAFVHCILGRIWRRVPVSFVMTMMRDHAAAGFGKDYEEGWWVVRKTRHVLVFGTNSCVLGEHINNCSGDYVFFEASTSTSA
jgi:hypothetical protein